MDPGLGIASNSLDIANKVKMKSAIFFALIHMSIGLILSGANHIHRKDWLRFFTETVMALVIMWGMIGYIVPYYIIKFFTGPELDSKADFDNQ